MDKDILPLVLQILAFLLQFYRNSTGLNTSSEQIKTILHTFEMQKKASHDTQEISLIKRLTKKKNTFWPFCHDFILMTLTRWHHWYGWQLFWFNRPMHIQNYSKKTKSIDQIMLSVLFSRRPVKLLLVASFATMLLYRLINSVNNQFVQAQAFVIASV